MRDYGSGVSVIQYLNVKQVAEKLSVTVRTVWAWSADGVRLPKPVYLGPRTPRWDSGTLELHLQRLNRTRRVSNKRRL